MHTPLSISHADRRPMYLQIMEQIRHLVAVGTWAGGDEIPSLRSLAADLRISVITIKRAYLELEARLREVQLREAQPLDDLPVADGDTPRPDRTHDFGAP
jgi:DNA-binding transcriptional MocR family regulator